jgi:hypothetical protein
MHCPFNDHFYERIEWEGTWYDAKAMAEAMTWTGYYGEDLVGHLAVLTSDLENEWVYFTMGEYLADKSLLGGYLDDGEWKWVTGEPFDYVNWAPGEPSNGTYEFEEIVLEFHAYYPGRWNDTVVDTK